ncbi:MAG TPA: hypothetical protein ENG63_09635 [Candidatus Desulfofervidus auxilii]|uniref:Uncharacterized protein n=1 Tax=Desulfofervidus auxilii TaxID=1621989 RepID=A0A7C0Y5S3_DESA2|nr:hypothetical protein [Candidatus Desulfofervidus auxilii]
MKIKAVVKKNQIIIPNFYNLKDGEIWLEVKFLDFHRKEYLEFWEKHLKEEKEKETSINSEIVKIVSEELGLKGITLKELINEKF